MAVVESPRLSFDHDLRHAYEPIQTRLQSGAKALDGVLEILRMRIDAEGEFTNSLQKIIGCSTNLMSHIPSSESLRTYGLDAMYTDLKNEYTQRMAFLNSLRDDVHKPLSKMRDFYYSQNKTFGSQIKSNIQSLKKQQNEFTKIKAKYDKVMGNTDITKKQTKKQQLLTVKRRFNQQQQVWKRQREQYDYQMTATLRSMESNEYKRMNALRDALTNWSAFITNYCANRSYDIRYLAQSMSTMDPEADLQVFMKCTLAEYPALPTFGGVPCTPTNGVPSGSMSSPSSEYDYPDNQLSSADRSKYAKIGQVRIQTQSEPESTNSSNRRGSTSEYIRGYFQRNRRASSSQSTVSQSISSMSTLAYTPSLQSDHIHTPEQLAVAPAMKT